MDRYVELLALAERHRGLVTRTELTNRGFSGSSISRLLRRGVLRAVHPGRVYAVGLSAVESRTRALAASLAVPNGWLSGVTAGRLTGLRGMPRDRLELSVVTKGRPRLDGVRVRRTLLACPDVEEQPDGLRLSSTAQCLFELAFELDDFALRSVHEDALTKGLVTSEALAAVGASLSRTGRPGSERFARVVLARAVDLPPVMSRDELVLLEALDDIGLPMVRQFRLVLPDGRALHLDGARPEIQFGLEVDGSTHDTFVQVQRDKHRDLRAAAVGWQVLRPTTDDVRRRLRLTVRWVLDSVAARRRQLGLG